jgi:hypothetical protein
VLYELGCIRDNGPCQKKSKIRYAQRRQELDIIPGGSSFFSRIIGIRVISDGIGFEIGLVIQGESSFIVLILVE